MSAPTAITTAANEAFGAAAQLVANGIAQVEWAHPMLAEIAAKRVVSYKEDLELLARVAKGVELASIHGLINSFEMLEREASQTVRVAYARSGK